uniref:hypothetical protein n=1 Tax=Thiomicrorhabdus sp. TaxID=2039724 RepID=UPI0029C8C11C
AARVNPKHKKLLEFWHNLIDKAAGGEELPDRIIKILEKLTPQEAITLDALMASGPHFCNDEEEKSRLSALKEQGLVEQSYTAVFLGYVIPLGVTLILFIVLSQSFPMFDMVKPGGLANTIGACGAICVLYAIALGFQLSRVGLGRWRLTWLGQKLESIVSRNEI